VTTSQGAPALEKQAAELQKQQDDLEKKLGKE
jgi:hypothetical protein